LIKNGISKLDVDAEAESWNFISHIDMHQHEVGTKIFSKPLLGVNRGVHMQNRQL
jgi:hypothetical protein